MSDSNVAPTNGTPKPSFTDLFAVHLSARLLRQEQVQKALDLKSLNDSSSHACQTKRLYWRTPLLMDVTDRTTCCTFRDSSSSSNGTVNDKWEIVFVDVSTIFDPLKRSVSTTIGTMLCHCGTTTDECHFVYVESIPVSFSQLQAHCESVGIDVQCTAPDAIAHTMGSALMRMGQRASTTSTTVKLQKANGARIETSKDLVMLGEAESVDIPIALRYEDLQETGALQIKSSEVLLLNSSASKAWLSSLMREDELAVASVVEDTQMVSTTNEAAAHDAQVSASLSISFDTWFTAPKRAASPRDATLAASVSAQTSTEVDEVDNTKNIDNRTRLGSAPATKTESTIADSSSTLPTIAPAASTIAEQETEEPPKKPVQQAPPAAKRPPAGYGRMTNAKRRRRGKLTFAKPST